MKNVYTHILLLSIALVALVACRPDTTCRVDEKVRMVMSVQGEKITTEDTVAITSVDSISVYGIGNDSVIIDNNKSVSSVSLPLRKNAEQTQFEMIFNGKADTMTIMHTNTDYFVSLACGCFVFHTIDTVICTHNVIDSVAITEHEIQNVEQNNLKLFLTLRD